MKFLELDPRVLLRGVHRRAGAECGGQLQPQWREIDGHDIGDASVTQGGDRGKPDGAGTEDRDFVPRRDVRPVDRVHPNAERLRERSHVHRKRVGDWKQATAVGRVSNEELLREATFGAAVADHVCRRGRVEHDPHSRL